MVERWRTSCITDVVGVGTCCNDVGVGQRGGKLACIVITFLKADVHY